MLNNKGLCYKLHWVVPHRSCWASDFVSRVFTDPVRLLTPPHLQCLTRLLPTAIPDIRRKSLVGCFPQNKQMSSSSSAHRSRSNNNNEERPRFFDSKAKSTCWAKAETVPGRHPERWRKDAAGNIVCKRFCNCHGCLCFEYDHIVPFSKGGESTADNCQILQTRVNRFKSDKELVDKTQLKGYSCDVLFTDKELDIIEMAVYGDVIRPGNQCRCKTVAEMLGKFKSKDRMAACKLPYDGESL